MDPEQETCADESAFHAVNVVSSGLQRERAIQIAASEKFKSQHLWLYLGSLADNLHICGAAISNSMFLQHSSAYSTKRGSDSGLSVKVSWLSQDGLCVHIMTTDSWTTEVLLSL